MKIKTLVLKGKQFNIYPLDINRLEEKLVDKLQLKVLKNTNKDILVEKSYNPRMFFTKTDIEIKITPIQIRIKLNNIKNAIKLLDMNGNDIDILGMISLYRMTQQSGNHIVTVLYNSENYSIGYEYHSTHVVPDNYIEELILNYNGRPIFKN